MDETEQPLMPAAVLAGIPPRALDLTLTRSAIRMQHSHSWSIDKVNAVHDLVICLEGTGDYILQGERIRLTPGMAMLIPGNTRFQGSNPDPARIYTGLAQHFRLELFGHHDLLGRMRFRRVVRLSRWPMLEPLVRHYRASAPAGSTTLAMHHAFMVMLTEFIDDAFIAWTTPGDTGLDDSVGLSMAITVAAAQIAADCLQPGLSERVVAAAPYNPDYFRREFRRSLGSTPAKYQEFKRMETGMQFLETGCSVAETAHRLGFADAYYFSRLFKRHIGISPRGWQDQVRLRRDGQWPRGQEDGQVIYPLRPGKACGTG
ncbi:helix-turn-helix domain-containing protein (plasmid) [Paracoccus liaowanqingii]|uniref:Helix-turn-helix domain-containing protein n=1 Tax=Paracoccus liaowanqingii TaxID=2560053 RepID=A0A4Y5STZ9_9RHOB|nr:AraC family transcriptional regulator [Paracoccus liaowanqingii]QDA36970.1 helix-turn-helix domain-containing protein [Paracoccus liaowanqingii]